MSAVRGKARKQQDKRFAFKNPDGTKNELKASVKPLNLKQTNYLCVIFGNVSQS